jgi:hypothetical protein
MGEIVIEEDVRMRKLDKYHQRVHAAKGQP